jgi:hypothetical protein
MEARNDMWLPDDEARKRFDVGIHLIFDAVYASSLKLHPLTESLVNLLEEANREDNPFTDAELKADLERIASSPW